MVKCELNIERIHKTAVSKGWWADPTSFAEKIALCHSELSEALEDYREGRGFDKIEYSDRKPIGIAVELADCLIRIADLCAFFGIPLAEALEKKMDYNEQRTWRHGNKKV